MPTYSDVRFLKLVLGALCTGTFFAAGMMIWLTVIAGQIDAGRAIASAAPASFQFSCCPPRSEEGLNICSAASACQP